MKKLKVICITMLICAVFCACDWAVVSPGVVIGPPVAVPPTLIATPNENTQSNTEMFIYVEHRTLQDNGDGDYGYVTQKVPLVAVNKLGEYLVDIDWGEESSASMIIAVMNLYLTDLHDESYADSFVYETLKKSEKSHTLMYVTEAQYQKLLQWSLPKKLTRIVDLTQTEDYKKIGYLDLEPDTPPLEDVFGD